MVARYNQGISSDFLCDRYKNISLMKLCVRLNLRAYQRISQFFSMGFSKVLYLSSTPSAYKGIIVLTHFSQREQFQVVSSNLAFRHTQYQLTRSDPGFDDSPSRSLPIFSLDSGLYFERNLGNGHSDSGSVSRQTLEPRLFYLHAPH